MFKIEHSPENRQVLIKIGKNKRNFEQGIRYGFYEIGKDLVKTAKDGILKNDKTGRIYSIGKYKHQASSAGQYPANRRPAIRRALNQSTNAEARLAFSLAFNVIGFREMHFGSKVPHGKWLQEGTSKIKPRPFLTLSVNANQRNAITTFQNEISKRM